MKILFSVLRPIALKNFESVIRTLSARGHEVEIVVHSRVKDPKLGELVPSLAAEPNVSLVRPPKAPPDPRAIRRTLAVRSSLDYLRFLDVQFMVEQDRRLDGVPLVTRFAAGLPLVRTPAGRRFLRRVLVAAGRAAPTSRGFVRFLEERRPEVALFTPYVERRTEARPEDAIQPELLRAAHRLGVPTAVCVASWDHLTLKSSICPQPDRVFVWNESQRREAAELHAVPRERVVVTGAQCYDEWFSWTPRPRADFCSRVGLDPARPYLLYTCFTPSRSGPSEVDFVFRWLTALRKADDPIVAQAGVLVRPHPGRTETWREVDVSEYENVVIFPREHGFPTDFEAKSDYFDSIYHSAAVMGLNTSAMLEAGVIGRPVLTVLAREFQQFQMDRPHFRYLREVAGGLVQAADSLDEHVQHLRRVLGSEAGGWGRDRTFVREFLRPHGLDVEATPIFVDEVERLAPPAVGGS